MKKSSEQKESLFKQMFVTRTLGFISVAKKKDFWKAMADQFNGELTVKKTIAGDLEKLILKLPCKEHTIEFTESDTHPLKITTELEAKHPFEFMISYEDTLEKLLKFFGKQDIQVGDKEFDSKYLIQGKDTNIVKQILSCDDVKTILLKNNVFSFGCNYNKKDNTLQLTSLVSRTVNSKEELSELYKLFCLTIDKMKNEGLIK